MLEKKKKGMLAILTKLAFFTRPDCLLHITVIALIFQEQIKVFVQLESVHSGVGFLLCK